MNTLKARDILIHYGDDYDLKKFNSKLYVKRNIKSEIRKHNISTIPNMVVAKINAIIDRVMVVFDVYIPPGQFNFGITILKDDDEVNQKFKEIYNKDVDYIAFYSRKQEMIFLSSRHSKLSVVTHEIGHAIAEMHFRPNSPSRALHEVIAQFAEKNIYD